MRDRARIGWERLVVSAHYVTSANLELCILRLGRKRAGTKLIVSSQDRPWVHRLGAAAGTPERGEECQLEILLLLLRRVVFSDEWQEGNVH